MANRDFYVTLSSNASVEYYPHNTLNHFRNRLAEPIRLDNPSQWQVALTEISAPANWSHVLSEEDLTVKLLGWRHERGLGDDVTLGQVQGSVTLKPFIHGRDLPKALSQALRDQDDLFKNGIKMTYAMGNNHVILTLRRRVFVTFSQRLRDALGLGSESVTVSGALGSEREKKSYLCALDINAGFRSLWVYSDCCEHRLVGDVRAPLLRTLWKNDYPEFAFHDTFRPPYYLPVSGGHLSSLEIVITDNTGKPIAFRPGEVVLTLHFRPRA